MDVTVMFLSSLVIHITQIYPDTIDTVDLSKERNYELPTTQIHS